MDRIKVEFQSEAANSEYGYYEKGDTGIVIGYTSGCAVVLKDDGSFVKAELKWIKEIKNISTELAESEDEKTKNEILAFLKRKRENSNLGWDVVALDRWIEWIEAHAGKTPKMKKLSQDDVRYPKHSFGSIVVDGGIAAVHIGNYYITYEELEKLIPKEEV